MSSDGVELGYVFAFYLARCPGPALYVGYKGLGSSIVQVPDSGLDRSLDLKLLQQLANLLAQRFLILDLSLRYGLPELLQNLARNSFTLPLFFFETRYDARQDLGDC